MNEKLRIDGYNARRGLATARRLISKSNQLYIKALTIASEKYHDPILTAAISKIGALLAGVDTLIEAALQGEDVSVEAQSLYADLLQDKE